MKQVIAVTSLTLLVTIASAQIPVPDLNGPSRYSSNEQMATVSVRRTSQLASMISYTGYTLGEERRTGATLTFQFTLFRSHYEAIDFSGGMMLRYKNVSDPVNESDYSPLGFRNPYSTNRHPALQRGIRFGMGFLGVDYTVYLTEGEVRPYVGLGMMLLGFPYQGAFTGTFAPALKAGILVNMTSGFSGFAEVKQVVGVVPSIGSPSAPFRGLTGLAFGLSFAPRFN